MARLLGEAYVNISPNFDGFTAKLLAGVKKSLAEVKASIPVTFDLPSQAKTQAKVTAAMKGVSASVPVTTDLGTKSVLQAKLSTLAKGVTASVPVTTDLGTKPEMQAKVTALLKGINAVLPISTDLGSRTELQAKVTALTKGVTASVPVTTDLGTKTALQAKVTALAKGVTTTIPVAFDPGSETALQAQVTALVKDITATIPVELELDKSAVAKTEAELTALTTDRSVTVGVNMDGAPAAFAKLKTLAAQSGLADFADVNINQSKIRTQLILLKRLMDQAGLSDFLSLDVNTANVGRQLKALSNLVSDIDIPVNLDTTAAYRELEILQTAVSSLDATIKVKADTSDLANIPVQRGIADIQAKFDTSAADASMATFMKSLQMMASDDEPVIRPGVDTGMAAVEIAAALAAMQAKAEADPIEVPFGMNAADFTKLFGVVEEGISKAQAEATANPIEVPFGMNAADFTKLFGVVEEGISKAQAEATANPITPEVNPAPAMLGAKLLFAALAGYWKDTGEPVITPVLNSDPVVASMTATLAAMQAAVAKDPLKIAAAVPNIDIAAALAKLTTLDLSAKQIIKDLGKITATVNTGPAMVQLAALKAAAADLSKQRLTIGSVSTASDIAAVSALSGAYDHLNSVIADTGLKEKEVAAGGLATLGASFITQTGALNGLAWGWGFLGTKVALFGGIGGRAVSVLHIMLDGILEVGIQLGMAAIGFTAIGLAIAAFAVAGELADDTLGRINDRMNAINTTASATGASFSSLTHGAINPAVGSFGKLAAVIRPQIFELLGEAINTVNTLVGGSGGKLTTFLGDVGQKLDQLGAKIEAFVTNPSHQHIFDDIIKSAVGFAEKFVTIFQNIGKALGTFFQVSEQTHIASYLLDIVIAGTKLLDLIMKLPQPLLVAAVALHGLYLWGGLLTTGVLKLLDPLRNLSMALGGVSKAGSALAELPDTASGFAKLQAAVKDIGQGFGNLGAAMNGSVGAAKAAADAAAAASGKAAAAAEAASDEQIAALARLKAAQADATAATNRAAADQAAADQAVTDAAGKASAAQIAAADAAVAAANASAADQAAADARLAAADQAAAAAARDLAAAQVTANDAAVASANTASADQIAALGRLEAAEAQAAIMARTAAEDAAAAQVTASETANAAVEAQAVAAKLSGDEQVAAMVQVQAAQQTAVAAQKAADDTAAAAAQASADAQAAARELC